MRNDFEDQLLQFVIQNNKSKKYAEILDNRIFLHKDNKVVYDIFQNYVKEYHVSPSQESLSQYFEDSVKGQDIESSVIRQIVSHIQKLYIPLQTETVYIRQRINTYVKKRETKELFKKYGGKVNEEDVKDDLFDEISNEFRRVKDIGQLFNNTEEVKHGFLIRDHNTYIQEMKDPVPIFLNGVNRLTAAGGFYSPQLILFMGGPKGFKTGSLILVCNGLVKRGLKVYYADTENGDESIKNRSQQAYLGTDLYGLYEHENQEILDQILDKIGRMGGDLYVDWFPAETCCIQDVADRLETLRIEHNWFPDVIAYDNLDNFIPSKSQDRRKDKRLQIQTIYHEAINFNKKHNILGFNLSQVRKEAVDKKVITLKDFAEDFGKAMNSHAAFALCRTEEEQESLVGRWLPVVQREGKKYLGKNFCSVYIQEETMEMREITADDLDKALIDNGFDPISNEPSMKFAKVNDA